MEVISVQKIVSDYCDLGIYKEFLGQNDRFKSGLLKVLANNGIKLQLNDSNRIEWDRLFSRYKRIVEKVDVNVRKGRSKFSQFSQEKLASTFFSANEFSSLLKAEKEPR